MTPMQTSRAGIWTVMFLENSLKVPSVVKGRLLGTENNRSAAKTGKGPVPGAIHRSGTWLLTLVSEGLDNALAGAAGVA